VLLRGGELRRGVLRRRPLGGLAVGVAGLVQLGRGLEVRAAEKGQRRHPENGNGSHCAPPGEGGLPCWAAARRALACWASFLAICSRVKAFASSASALALSSLRPATSGESLSPWAAWSSSFAFCKWSLAWGTFSPPISCAARISDSTLASRSAGIGGAPAHAAPSAATAAAVIHRFMRQSSPGECFRGRKLRTVGRGGNPGSVPHVRGDANDAAHCA